jgi:CheY-like chemotaxis protein
MARILIVEDNDMNWDMLSRRLERRGFQVTRALDGREGVTAATARPPDLILMDMGLPVMDGWEATKILKSTAATAAIPIIGLTAHAMAADRQKSLDAGCDDYEIKPVDLGRLLEKIDTLLGRARR